jgi:hypothetical protein
MTGRGGFVQTYVLRDVALALLNIHESQETFLQN